MYTEIRYVCFEIKRYNFVRNRIIQLVKFIFEENIRRKILIVLGTMLFYCLCALLEFRVILV